MDRLIDTFFGVDPELLHQADQILARHGISLSEAVVAVLEQVVRDQSPPAQLLEAAGREPEPIAEADDEQFEEAVQHVAKGSVYTSAEIKAYLRQMGRL